MKDSAPHPHDAQYWGKRLGVVGAILMIYILSSGPAVFLRERGVVSKQFVKTVYRPLVPLEEISVFDNYWDGGLREGDHDNDVANQSTAGNPASAELGAPGVSLHPRMNRQFTIS